MPGNRYECAGSPRRCLTNDIRFAMCVRHALVCTVRSEHAIRHLARGLGVFAWQQHGEFLTAQPCHETGDTFWCLQRATLSGDRRKSLRWRVAPRAPPHDDLERDEQRRVELGAHIRAHERHRCIV